MSDDDLAVLDAAGALTADERAEFERALTGAPREVRAEVARLRDLMTSVTGALVGEEQPSASVRDRVLAGIVDAPPPVPPGFFFRLAQDEDWKPLGVPGIRMKLLSLNQARGYATLLLDVAPGSRWPAHHHGAAEECYVISGSVMACGRRMVAGDFLHADAGTDHDELWTDEGCRVILVVDPRDYLSQR